MFRNLFRIFLIVLVIAFVRYVVMTFGRALRNPPPPRKKETAKQPSRGGDELKGVLRKDPQCGTYVSDTSSVKLEAGGELHHFCSDACRDEFAKRFQRS